MMRTKELTDCTVLQPRFLFLEKFVHQMITINLCENTQVEELFQKKLHVANKVGDCF